MFSFVFDLIFPKRCVGCRKTGAYLCSNCFAQIEVFQQYMCPMCLRSSIAGETHPSCITMHGLDGISCGVVYKGVIKKLLFRFKHAPYLSNLGTTIGKLATETLSQNELFMRVLYLQPIVVEVPLSSQKLKSRGYNQAEILARQVATEFKLPFIPKMLIQVRPANFQRKLNKLQRFKNVENIFELNSKNRKLINKKTVLLVDDLATTCATLRECAKVLKRNGAKKVYGVTFAREL